MSNCQLVDTVPYNSLSDTQWKVRQKNESPLFTFSLTSSLKSYKSLCILQLKLGRYLRNVHSVGWDLPGQTKWVSDYLCKTFYCWCTMEISLQPAYLGLRFFLDFKHILTHISSFLSLLFVLLFHPISFKLSLLDCTDQWTYSDANLDFVGPEA